MRLEVDLLVVAVLVVLLFEADSLVRMALEAPLYSAGSGKENL